VQFNLKPVSSDALFPQYAIALHAWFLAQVRQFDPTLSARLHDDPSEKAFTVSALDGPFQAGERQLHLIPEQTYRWYVTGLSHSVTRFLHVWLDRLPGRVEINKAPLKIDSTELFLAPTTYRELLESGTLPGRGVKLTFLSPTSFRRKGYHFPLPVPYNLFHSYLRRWNDFSGIPVEADPFLNWVDSEVLIRRHQIESVKVPGGKRGSVTGFTGAIDLGLAKRNEPEEFARLFYTLSALAPYCGTGHKTTFGLGQTRSGWLLEEEEQPITTPVEERLAQRIANLTDVFMAQRQRLGKVRIEQIEKTARTRATILARRETGESLQAIARDLELPYETVKTYAKLARRALRESEGEEEESGDE
jgi:CRISPR-associated endoribonuclease Cas6